MNDLRTAVGLADAVSRLNQKHGSRVAQPREAGAVDIAQIVGALNEFMECVRYLNTRRSKSAVLALDSEPAVQDAIYLMLRPWILDLVPENPAEKVGNRYTIRDFVSQSARTVIEAKYIRDKSHGKNISKELHDDIETYRHHPACRHLVFFLYDPDSLVPDHGALERQIAVERVYAGVPLTCHLIVKP